MGRLRNSTLKKLILAEILCVLIAAYGVYYMSFNNVIYRQAAAIYASISSIDNDKFAAAAEASFTKYQEQIIEEPDELLWTAEEVEYRTGPGESYASAGTLDAEKLVRRTGITMNEWSRLSLDEEDYYVKSASLTDETPISALIASGTKGDYQKYALSLFPDFGWSDSELEPLIYLWNRESGWNPRSHNKRSGAHGIPQALPAKKMASEGSDYYTSGYTQIRWGLKYIKRRYGSPSAAWSKFKSRGWY